MPETLFTTRHVAKLIGENEKWVHRCWQEKDGPQPSFEAQIHGGPRPAMLWTADQMDQWLAFRASDRSTPKSDQRRGNFSDHRAVNQASGITVTWKLWWHNGSDGPVWWFSTPLGWYNSNDDGATWWQTGLDVRPDHFAYFAVNGSIKPAGHVAAMLRSAATLRNTIERNHQESEL